MVEDEMCPKAGFPGDAAGVVELSLTTTIGETLPP